MSKAKATPMSRNPADLKFKSAPFYNLANIRKDIQSIILRTHGNDVKAEAIAETLEVSLAFLKTRHDHAVAVRAKDVADKLEKAAAAELVREGAELANAVSELEAADAASSAWGKVVAALTPKAAE